MEMQIKIDPTNKVSVINTISVLKKLIGEDTPTVSLDAPLSNGLIRAKKSTAAAPAVEPEADTFGDLSGDEDTQPGVTDDATGEYDDVGDDAPPAKAAAKPAAKKAATAAAPAATKKKITQSEIIKGLQSYAAEHGRPEAAKLLKKYNVKAVKDVKETDYDKFMKDLKG